jgi:UDP-N-acetylglucosamine 2-epimerase
MKALLIVFALFSVQYVRSQTTYTYPFESHFIDNGKEERKWIDHSHKVIVKKNEIIISDKSNEYVYTITKESIPKPEKGYTVYEVIRNGKRLSIMRPADFSYFMVMESRDKPVWVLSDSKF